MKNKVIVLMCLLILLTLTTGCGKGEKGQTEQEIVSMSCLGESSNSEMTQLDLSKPLPSKQLNTVRYDMGDLSMIAPIKTDEEKVQQSEVIIRGIVTKTQYAFQNNFLFSKDEIRVLQCYKGAIRENESIIVAQMGGFVPADIYRNTVLKNKFGKEAQQVDPGIIYDIRTHGFKAMEEGENVILFLNSIDQNEYKGFEDVEYVLVREWQGELLFNEEAGLFLPYIPKEELPYVETKYYTADEFEAFIKAEQVD